MSKKQLWNRIQWIIRWLSTWLGVWVHLEFTEPFGEPLQFTLGIPTKNSSYLHTKQRPLWLHVSFFTHFNQPVTINIIAAVTLLKKEENKILTYEWYHDA